MTRKQRAAIYRKAARLVERGEEYACCHAIEKVIGARRDSKPKECLDMRAIFDGRNNLGGHWMAESGEDPYSDEIRPRRILALCFMAAMVEAGDAMTNEPGTGPQ